MSTSHAFRQRLVLLLCGLTLLLQICGAHLHLCFDGQEPPVTLHLLDSGAEHVDVGASAPHHDENVAAESSALRKTFALDLGILPALLALFTLGSLRPRLILPLARRRGALIFRSIFDLLPPLRGPPATTPA
jgi:hypothetical protein